MIDYEMLGKRISEARKKKGMTQERLAEAIGLSTEYVSEIENCRKKASLTSVVSIAKTLGMSLDELVLGDIGEDGDSDAIKMLMMDCSEYEKKVLSGNLDQLKQLLREFDKLR